MTAQLHRCALTHTAGDEALVHRTDPPPDSEPLCDPVSKCY